MSSVKNIFKDLGSIFKRLNISKMRSRKRTFRITIRKSEERFRTKTKETVNRLNMRKNINIRKPAISQENNMIIFVSEKISTIGNATFNKVNRISIRIVYSFETAKPKRNTVVYQCEERKEE